MRRFTASPSRCSIERLDNCAVCRDISIIKESKIEIRKSKRNGQFRFVIIAANGEPLATSESYTTKSMCKKGINAVIGAFNGHHGDPNIIDTTA